MFKRVQNPAEKYFTCIYELHNIYEFLYFVHLLWLQTKGEKNQNISVAEEMHIKELICSKSYTAAVTSVTSQLLLQDM